MRWNRCSRCRGIGVHDGPAHAHRLNKVNLRKEFFRASIDQIAEVVRKSHGHVDYKATPDAFQFLETKAVEERGSMAFPLEFIEPTLDEQLAET